MPIYYSFKLGECNVFMRNNFKSIFIILIHGIIGCERVKSGGALLFIYFNQRLKVFGTRFII